MLYKKVYKTLYKKVVNFQKFCFVLFVYSVPFLMPLHTKKASFYSFYFTSIEVEDVVYKGF